MAVIPNKDPLKATLICSNSWSRRVHLMVNAEHSSVGSLRKTARRKKHSFPWKQRASQWQVICWSVLEYNQERSWCRRSRFGWQLVRLLGAEKGPIIFIRFCLFCGQWQQLRYICRKDAMPSQTMKTSYSQIPALRTPHYHGQFVLSLGKESPYIFSKFNPLNRSTSLMVSHSRIWRQWLNNNDCNYNNCIWLANSIKL